MKSVTFTADDFLVFHTAVLMWIDRLGITGWGIEVRHEQIGERVNAQCQYNSVGRNVVFRLTHTSEGDFAMITDPKLLALHEVLHLFLAEFCEVTAKLGDAHHDHVIAIEHSMIHRLMGVLK